MNDAPARQIGRKFPPRRLAPREALHFNAFRSSLPSGLGRVLCGGRSYFLELQRCAEGGAD
jgi:hypothetical protein